MNRNDCETREQAWNFCYLLALNGNSVTRKIRCQPTKHIRSAEMLTNITIRIINVPVHLLINPSEKQTF